MRSDDRSESFDLERDLPTTAEDVAALRRARQHPPLATEDYLRFLKGLPAPDREALRRRGGPRGEPFDLLRKPAGPR